MKIYNPGWMFRGLVLVTQGVFYNLLFVSYLLSPSAVHRFVGYLEEEAVVTYTQIVDEMERGHIPEWAPGAREVPQIAKDYWRMGPDATMKDLILAVRADESNHRYVLPSSSERRAPSSSSGVWTLPAERELTLVRSQLHQPHPRRPQARRRQPLRLQARFSIPRRHDDWPHSRREHRVGEEGRGGGQSWLEAKQEGGSESGAEG